MSAFNRQESRPVHGGWRRRCYGDRLGICNLTTSILQEWGVGRGSGRARSGGLLALPQLCFRLTPAAPGPAEVPPVSWAHVGLLCARQALVHSCVWVTFLYAHIIRGCRLLPRPVPTSGPRRPSSSHGHCLGGASPSAPPACSFGRKPGLACEEAGILTFRMRREELRQSEGHILGWIWFFHTDTHMQTAAGVGWGENGAGEAGSTPKLES